MAGPDRRVTSCRTAPAGSSRGGAPSPSCWPTCTATPTCSTRSACAATDGVALLAPNCDELITATLAARARRHRRADQQRPVPEHIAELLRRSGARVLVAAGPELAPDVWETARELAAEAGARRPARAAARPAAEAAPDTAARVDGVRVGYLVRARREQRPDRLRRRRRRRPPTSPPSSTPAARPGTPKLAAHTHANEVTDAWMIAANALLDADSVVFAALPLFHVNALVVTLLAPLFKGQQVVWAGPLGYRDPALFAQLLEDRRALPDRRDERRADRLRRPRAAARSTPTSAACAFAIVGASPLPPAVRDGFESPPGCRWSRATA